MSVIAGKQIAHPPLHSTSSTKFFHLIWQTSSRSCFPAAFGTQFTNQGRASIVLEGKDSGLAAGQFAAFYRGEECLGAGSISDATFLPEIQ